MSETYEFGVAEPVKRPARKGAGRKAAPNPFEDAVKAIAGERDADGNPLARKAVFSLDTANGETFKQRKARIRRFLTRAAKDLAAANKLPVGSYSIELAIEQGETPDVYVAKFWDRGPRSSALA